MVWEDKEILKAWRTLLKSTTAFGLKTMVKRTKKGLHEMTDIRGIAIY